ncbi:hypothetical protein DSL72_005467 [Monilinia vaccinii-corymbosi]|uniref:Chitin-binding type-4 domain-containing protein n=1 Tax=Monilinia vaccinii-corymbosi TaxID=61207 RepID=A0A8A3PFR7_9HELO|nr:hypothetical protein DSL72_005467 [Monilinia vaccinii-corymbosi]
MFSKATTVALAFAAVSNAHMIMTSPVPYGADSLNSSPLMADGSDFPCKQRSGVYEVTTQNAMELGGSYDLAFKGSAVHGGGSCQVSITYDENPTAKSTFKVIHSIIGGCPMKNTAGNAPENANAVDPNTYKFTIPSNLPSGKATIAWTWFNKIGNREMYMNCAPVTISGSNSTKRSDLVERDQAAFSALPDMFVANVGNGCGTAESFDVVFPNPGDSVEFDGGATSTATSTPTGHCVAPSGGPKPSGGASYGATSASPVATSAPSAGTGYNTSLPGGVFITVPTGGPGSAPTYAPSVASSATSVPVVAASAPEVASSAPSVPVVAASAPTNLASAPAPAGTGSTSSSSSPSSSASGGLTGACTSEGMFNCVNGSSFQQCASGTWSVVQPLASGTTCTAGQTKNLVIAKRGVKGVMRNF